MKSSLRAEDSPAVLRLMTALRKIAWIAASVPGLTGASRFLNLFIAQRCWTSFAGRGNVEDVFLFGVNAVPCRSGALVTLVTCRSNLQAI
jgi:hypothetical protein